MSFITRLSRLFIPKHTNTVNLREFSVFRTLQLKQVLEEQKGNEIVIRGEYVESPRQKFLVKTEHEGVCPLCSAGIELKHTDVLILSQFLRSDGCMLPRRITGLCQKQQRKVSTLVAMAQKAGLMPNLNPSYSKKDPKKRFGWKKHNKYFDESTIKF